MKKIEIEVSQIINLDFQIIEEEEGEEEVDVVEEVDMEEVAAVDLVVVEEVEEVVEVEEDGEEVDFSVKIIHLKHVKIIHLKQKENQGLGLN